MPTKRLLLFILLLTLLAFTAQAQETSETLLSLQADTTDVETGQTYTVDILVEDVEELWGVEVFIAYDPQLVYIIGTRSGSPVRTGEFMGSDTFLARNSVDEDAGQLAFAISRLGQVDPLTGSGIIGSFDIYPLQAGETDLRFASANLVKLNFELDENGQRTNVRSEALTFTPVLLPLSITGETVAPPSEATATPMPTATLDPNFAPEGSTEEPQPTELVNATPIPRDEVAETVSTGIPLLPIAVGLIGFAVVGLFVLVIVYRRRG